MSCIVLNNELEDKNFIKEFGVFLLAKFKDTHFVLEKGTNPQNKKLAGICVEQRTFGLQ